MSAGADSALHLGTGDWEVPENFGVDRYPTELLALHHSGRELAVDYRLFALRCRRP